MNTLTSSRELIAYDPALMQSRLQVRRYLHYKDSFSEKLSPRCCSCNAGIVFRPYTPNEKSQQIPAPTGITYDTGSEIPSGACA
ncbi:MAG: hypothetical protein L0L66_05095, partial [Bifidobacterium crudilactis]|nr:hypothetical protein [Bifidobacterium crudilactis]